jgi:ribose transport system permease protein
MMDALSRKSSDKMQNAGGKMTENAFGAAAPDYRKTAKIKRETITACVVFGLTAALILSSRFVSSALGGWDLVGTVLILASFLIVVSFGQGLVILIGGLDLSIPALITLSGVLTASWIGVSGDGSWYLFPLIMAACGSVGAISGMGIVFLNIPPFIMTMATGIIVASSALGFTHGSPRGGASALLLTLMKGSVAGAPLIILFVLLFCVLAVIIQSRTSLGRRLMAIGSNAKAAVLAGIPTKSYIIMAYTVSAMSAALAGMLLVGYANGATLRMGDGYLLSSIASVVVGGSSILGGRGSYVSTIGGALLLTTLGIVISALGVPQGWRTVIEGCTILFALLLLRENIFLTFSRPKSRH